MKKIILLSVFTLYSIGLFAQALTPKKADSIAANSFNGVVYPNPTLKASLDSVTAIYRKALAQLNYISPPVYTVSGPIKLQSNHTYQYLTIDLKNNPITAMGGVNIQNVIIKHCRILNTTTYGINIYGGVNILADSNYFNMVGCPIYFANCKQNVATNNQCLNLNDVGLMGKGVFAHFIQFDNCSGGGQKMNYNRIENIAGVANNPHDLYSVYQSNGLPGDSIQMIGNWARGGQLYLDAKKDNGATGGGLGDVGGSYQVARYNIMVNTGASGMQVVGGTHIKMDHNIIVGTNAGFSYEGLGFGHYDTKPCSDVTIAYNQIKWLAPSGNESDIWADPSAGFTPNGWNTNILKAPINPSVLPTQIITFK